MNRTTNLCILSFILLLIILISLFFNTSEEFNLSIDGRTYYGDFKKTCSSCTYNYMNNNLSCNCNNGPRSNFKINDTTNIPNITNIGNNLALADNQYKVLKHFSGKCARPQANRFNSGIVFSDNCNDDSSRFMFLDNGALQHKASGLCVHPYGGRPRANGHLVLGDNCWQHGFKQLDNKSIQNTQSGMCIHPLGGSQNPSNGTLLVLHPGCGENPNKLNFELV